MSNLGPYSGLKVLDMDSDIAGSYASMMLADLGADVTRINLGFSEIGLNDSMFNLWNRGKSYITADPTCHKDMENIQQLACFSDVVINTHRPNLKTNQYIELDLVALKQNNVIYCLISPFGETGPLANYTGDEGVVSNHVGLYGDQGGWEQHPVFIHLPVASYGAAFLAINGIGAALLSADKRKSGLKLNISLYDSAIAMFSGSAVLSPNVTPWIRYAKDQKGANPVYRLYQSSDGEWIFIACGNETFWNKLCIALDRLDWITDPKFDGAPWNLQLDNRDALIKLIQDLIITRDSAYWVQHFQQYDVPSTIASTKKSFVSHPQIQSNHLFDSNLKNKRTIGLPLKFQRSPGKIGEAPVKASFKDTVTKIDEWFINPKSGSEYKIDFKQHGPLKGVKIIDLTGYISGSYAASILARLGADVIKVESPTGDGFRALGGSFQAWNHGKRGVVIDLKVEQGKEVLYELVEQADVVMENYRPGVSKSLNVDYKNLKRINPNLIYLSLTGFGSAGPMREKAAFDPLIQAMSGAMIEQSGSLRDPVFLKLAMADYASSMLASFGVISALVEKKKNGLGQRIETSLLHAAVAVQAGEFQMFFDQTLKNRNRGIEGPFATYRLYKTVDGYVFLSCQDNKSFKRACAALGLDILWRKYCDFKLRETNDKLIGREFENVIGELKTDQVLNALRSVGVGCSASSHTINFHSDSHAITTGLTVESDTFVGPVKQMGTPFIFDSHRATDIRSAPDLGEHSKEVLIELGYSSKKIDDLKEIGAII